MTRARRVLISSAGVLALTLAIAGWWFFWTRELPLASRTDWTGRVITLAGSGADGVRDASAFRSEFADPFGVAVANDGTIFVADGVGAHRIRRITPDGRVSTLAGSVDGFADGAAAAARFSSPSGVAVGPDGAVYVADTGNNAIRRIAPDGTVSTVSAPGAGLNGPLGVAVNPQGGVVVADSYNDRVVALTPDGTLQPLAGTGEPGFDDGPAGTARFDTPVGIAIDGSGNIFVADAGNGAVRVISTTGEVRTIAPGAVDGRMRPLGIAVSATGSVFVADDRAGIIEVTPDRGQRTIAGSRSGYADGDGSAARFRSPSGVAILGERDLVVTDRRNGMLRRVVDARTIDVLPPAPPLAARFDSERFDRTPLLWPFAPLDGPFEITGTLGEPRGGVGTERLHAGLDVHAAEGTEVRVVRAAYVDDPFATADLDSINEWARVGPVTYVHIRVGRDRRGVPFDDRRFVATLDPSNQVVRMRLKRGSRFATGELIGTVNRFYHVHLNIGWPGEEVNPLHFRLPGFADTIAPRIAAGGIRLIAEDGALISRREKRRLVVDSPVRIVVDAWDQVDGNLPRRRLGLYSLGYQLLQEDGTPAPGYEVPRETIRFDRHPRDAAAARTVYASGSGIPVYGNRSSRFLYVVTSTLRDGVATDGTLDPAALPPGDYTLRITAADIHGNVALANRDLAITIPARGAE